VCQHGPARIQVSGFGIRVSDFECQVFGFRILGFGFRVTDFEYRVLGFRGLVLDLLARQHGSQHDSLAPVLLFDCLVFCVWCLVFGS